MTSIIRSIRRYCGKRYWWLTGKRVVVTAVRRTDGKAQLLCADAEIRDLRPDDVVEISPLVPRADGTQCVSHLIAEAEPFELGRAEGVFEGPPANGTSSVPGTSP